MIHPPHRERKRKMNISSQMTVKVKTCNTLTKRRGRMKISISAGDLNQQPLDDLDELDYDS
jgi:hypothetical protein